MDAQSDVKEFFEGFQLYQQIIENNYMAHKEIFQWMLPRFQQQKDGIKILELGCGDDYIISKISEHVSIDQYIGVDLSEHALAFAEKNLSKKIQSLTLRSGDMSKAIQKIKGSFDIIIGSYSIHHLVHHEKQKMMHFIHQRLAPSGRFFLIDTISTPQESREAYLKRASTFFMTKWVNINPEHLANIESHVQDYDFPESFESIQDIGLQAGMKTVSADYLDAEHLFGAMELKKR